jgi:hypothetical protein
VAWTDPRTWVAGETVTAALMNTHVRDNFKALGDPWTSYTPVWTAVTTNPTLGNGTLTGTYVQTGKLVIFKIRLAFGSTTTLGSGAYRWTLPVASNFDINASVGNAVLWDDSATTNFTRVAAYTLASPARVVCAAQDGTLVSNTVPVTWANADKIQITGMYEAS